MRRTAYLLSLRSVSKSEALGTLSPEERRAKYAKRERGMGKALRQDPQTLKIVGGLVGRFEWPEEKFNS